MISRRELRRQLEFVKGQLSAERAKRLAAEGAAATATFNQQRLAGQAAELLAALEARPVPVLAPEYEPSQEWLRERADLKGQVSDLTRRLRLAEIRGVGLAEQVAALRDANEAMCRKAVDRAGTLAPREAAR